jgi:hypothetical protein
MKVKYMTLEQVKRIMDNNFMGDPSKGYGFDYVDYKEEIQHRYWELLEKKENERFKLELEAYNRGE